MSSRNLETIRGYAKLRGVSANAVRKAIDSGRITTIRDTNGNLKIDPDQANHEWFENTDPKFFTKEAREVVSAGRKEKHAPREEQVDEDDLEKLSILD